MVVLFLETDKIIDQAHKLGRWVFYELMEAIADSQRRKGHIIDKCWPQVSEFPRVKHTTGLKYVASDEEVCNTQSNYMGGSCSMQGRDEKCM
jgi:hypothetical protein